MVERELIDQIIRDSGEEPTTDLEWEVILDWEGLDKWGEIVLATMVIYHRIMNFKEIENLLNQAVKGSQA